MMIQYKDVDDYIASFPKETQILLEQMRAIVREAAPEATESISYAMPSYKLNGALVYFGAYAKHIGFYPTGSGIATFKEELSGYKGSKGTVQFPLNKPLPLELIAKIVKWRVDENLIKASTKKK